MAPRAEFAARLRRRLEAEIHGTDPEGAPVTVTELVPSLIVSDADAAIRFYVEALGATEEYRFDDGDRVGHAELSLGGHKIFVADAYPEYDIAAPEPGRRQSVGINLGVADARAAFDRAIAHGATVERPVQDQFYGDRSGTFRDPFGHTWTVTQRLETLDDAEIRRRFEEQQGQ
jgi:uncharacterized glyoxalase superfamily protein PhnB